MPTILGTTDTVTTCECCGRSDLKTTVVFGNEDGTPTAYYGSECAAKFSGTTKAVIAKTVATLAKKVREQAEKDRNRKANADRAAYDAWKLATYGNTTDSLDRHQRYRKETA